jgi:hypothetical protein
LDEFIPREAVMHGYASQNGGKCAQPERVVIGDGDVISSAGIILTISVPMFKFADGSTLSKSQNWLEVRPSSFSSFLSSRIDFSVPLCLLCPLGCCGE